MKQAASTAAASPKSAGPGETIRTLRMNKGLTLRELSARTGLGVSALSKLEKGRMSLTYDKLMLLSKALGVDMAQLLDSTPRAVSSPQGMGRRATQRRDEGQLIENQSYRHLYLATDLRNKRFTPMVIEPKASSLQQLLAEYGDYIRHPGEEFAMVMEGEVVFHSELYSPLRLGRGDSVYFDSEMGHAYVKASDDPCRVVVVCTPRGGDEEMFDALASPPERPARPPQVVRAKPAGSSNIDLKPTN